MFNADGDKSDYSIDQISKHEITRPPIMLEALGYG